MSKKIALIDGYGFVFRAFHSLPPLTRADNTPVGAVYGFTNMLIKLLAGLDVSHVAVVFDSGSKTFRNDIFPKYKANRPPCPEELKPQFPLVRQAAEALNLAILEKTGLEADDIIATIAKKSAAEGYEVVIVSSDKDLMQLVDEKISMYDAMKNRMIGENEVKEKFFVGPKQVLDVLALMGDSSDNIPGVKGIGPKTAAELIETFGSLENIFANLSEIKQEKRRQLLQEGVENARLSKVLASLKDDAELGIAIDDLKLQNIEPYKLISFLEEQGFRSLVLRVKKEFNLFDDVRNVVKEEVATKKFSQIKTTEITDKKILDDVIAKAQKNGLATIDLFDEEFLTISTCKKDCEIEEIFFAKLQSKKSYDLFDFTTEEKGDSDFVFQGLVEILNDDSVRKVFFDSKSFFKKILQHNFAVSQNPSPQPSPSRGEGEEELQISPSRGEGEEELRISPSPLEGEGWGEGSGFTSFDDISLINHLLNSTTKSDLRQLIDANLDEDIESKGFGEIFAELEKNKTPKLFEQKEKEIEFFTFKNFAIYQLYKLFLPKIFELKLNNAYYSYELPLLAALAQIEHNGIAIDVTKLNNLSQEFGQKIAELSKEIYAIAGEEFNIASTQQLGKILFEKLNLESSKKSKKTGAFSTASEVLEELAEEGFTIAGKVLEFRKFSKLKNTYTDALPKEINEITKRIHTSFSSISTITGRLSSSNPNLQNIPIKTAEGRKIRTAFIAEKNNLLISADYSQIELRVIAHVAKIENLIQAFKDGKDIHRITASQVFKIAENEVSDDLRSKAKAINFGIIYGISAFGLARQLGISRQEAGDYIKSYLDAYPGIDEYMRNYINLARQNGYVTTLSGRKCFIHEINNKNQMIRSEAERLAINAPIQGSAADIIKMAMIRLQKKLNDKAKIVLQVHDELVVEAPESKVEEISQIVRSEMENAVILDLPLKVDVTIGKFWE